MIQTYTSTPLQPPEWLLRLDGSHLSWLLSLSDNESDLSPREMLGPLQRPETEKIQQLVHGGIIEPSTPNGKPILTSHGRQIVTTLTDSSTAINVRIWSSERMACETTGYFPGNLCSEPGILLYHNLDNSWQIGGMVDASQLISLATALIPSEPEQWITALGLEAHLDSTTAAVFCAILDIARTAYRRQQFPDTGLEPGTAFSPGDVSGYLHGSWGLSGFDQLITYLPATVMQGTPPQLSEIECSINTLIAHEYCYESITGRLVIGDQLGEIVPALYGLRSGFQWLRTSLLSDGETATANRVFLVGPHGAVLLFSPTVAGHVYIKLSSGDEIAHFLADEASTILPLRSPSNSPGENNRCPQCQNECPQTAKFCPQCGFKLVEAKKERENSAECPQCHAPLRTGARFCTHCGLSIKQDSKRDI